ncbi:hypothetical protein [Nonomuraea sp. LPB2021202275-12-8]|uniref:hypothetical protein n=1 Tax=Nonomuraea sp. LPB2021202275-12-8 TaxID=3120159 RepID=UPI00300D9B0E
MIAAVSVKLMSLLTLAGPAAAAVTPAFAYLTGGGHYVHVTDNHPAFMSALTTEHFVLQTAASTATSEESARATLYVMALSSSLVALGFAAPPSPAFTPLASALLPSLVILGLFTSVRLVDTGLQNIQCRSAMARIRRYYRELYPQAAAYIIPWAGPAEDDVVAAAAATLGIGRRRDWLIGFFSIAMMIATINSIVTGAGITLLTAQVLPLAAAIALGLLASAVHLVLFYLYQRHRYSSRPALPDLPF